MAEIEFNFRTLLSLIWCPLLIFLPVESSNLISLKEGEAAELSFQYDFVPEVDIRIRIGNRTPFYRYKQTNRIDGTGLSQSQLDRFSVEKSEPVPNYLIVVRVNIAEVKREDAGTFTCSMYKDGEILKDYTKKIGVRVESPPGKAVCRHEKHLIDTSNEVWALLKCVASAGDERGLVECYQSGERVPPWSRPIQNETTLTQIVWMKKRIRIFCCTSTFDSPKGRCNCNDYIWDPMSQGTMPSGLNPCPPALIPESVSPSNEIDPKSISSTLDVPQIEGNGDSVEVDTYMSELELIPFTLMIGCLNLVVLVGGFIVLFCRSKKTGEIFPKEITSGHLENAEYEGSKERVHSKLRRRSYERM